MPKLSLTKFRGMVTDIAETHEPDNSFNDLYNWRLTQDKALEKIPGYMKWSDYDFDSAINNINQLVRVEDRNTFVFSDNNIYRMDVDKTVNILKEDYPVTQVKPYNEHAKFGRVRTVTAENRIWCVDKNVYPFFVYNLSDESGVNLNVWAKLLVTGSDTITIVDSNDATIIYGDPIIIPDAFHDGSDLVIRYNDGNNIYIFSNSWGYKFNYSGHKYELVGMKDFSKVIIDYSFRALSFGINYSDGTDDEWDYNFIVVGAGSSNYTFWTAGNITRGIYGIATRSNIRTDIGSSYFFLNSGGIGIIENGKWESWNPWAGGTDPATELNIDCFAMMKINFTDVHNVNFTATIAGLNQNFSDDISAFSVAFNLNLNLFRALGLHKHVYVKLKTRRRIHVAFVKDDILYAGCQMQGVFTWKSYIALYYEAITFEWIVHQLFGLNNFEDTVLDSNIVKKYDILNNMSTVVVTESVDDLLTMIAAGDYDLLLMNDQDISSPDTMLIYYNSFETVEKWKWRYYNTTLTPVVNYYNLTEVYWNNLFKFKAAYTNQELFYPYITKYNSADWEVRMLGTPGRPYIRKSTGGSLTGDYKFFISYVTTLNTKSETYKSEPYQPPTFANEDAIVYWATIPADYYGYTWVGLRIYVQEVGVDDIPKLVKEVVEDADPTSEWGLGYATINDITEIVSILNVTPYFPKMSLIGTHLTRMVMSGNKKAPNNYYFSEAGDFDDNPLTNLGVLYPQDKDRIIGYTTVAAKYLDVGGVSTDMWVVFKEHHIYGIVGDLAIPQGSVIISEKYGCFAPDTIVGYKGTIIFLGYAGLCLLDGMKVIEVTRGLMNNWLFKEHTVNELRNSFAWFDIDNKEYRLHIGRDIFVFNLNNDFYIERKLNDSHLYTAAFMLDDETNTKSFLFATTQHNIFEDRKSNHWNGRKRWAYLKSKKFKLSEMEEKSMLQRFNLNAVLNSDLALIGNNDLQVIEPGIDNYYVKRVKDFCDGDIQFELYERSSWDAKIMDMELIYE